MTLQIEWNTKDLEIRTKSVEKTLEPLIRQVTTLMNQDGLSRNKKGRSKKAHVLSATVQKANENFISQGKQIAAENKEIQNDMMFVVNEVQKSGEQMRLASIEFADDPCCQAKRSNMVKAARVLLSDVTKLLILADMVDVYLLLKSLKIVEGDLNKIRNAQNQQELSTIFDDYDRSLNELNNRAGRRQMDLIDVRGRDDMAAARATLKKSSIMLLTTSKSFVRHPELSAARDNRDYVLKQICDAVVTISDVAQATGSGGSLSTEKGVGELVAVLNDFEKKIIVDPRNYSETKTRPTLEQLLEGIVADSAVLADSGSTRDERRDKIVKECQAVRAALQDLLSEYMDCAQKPYVGMDANLDLVRDQVYARTKNLRKQLTRAVLDHVSDSFMDLDMPIMLMIEAAKRGNEQEMEQYALLFQEQAAKLIEVANIVCSISTKEEGVKMIRLASKQLDNLCPQVINAARVLVVRPESKVALENMDVFKDVWLRQVLLLTDAVDDVTIIDDFLAVSEGHILEDINKCVSALQERDAPELDRTAGNIRARCMRVCDLVTTEMTGYERGAYTDRVMEFVTLLREQIVVKFVHQMNETIENFSEDSNQGVNEEGFVQVSNMVYDGVRNIRRAVLNNQNADFDSDIDDDDYLEVGHFKRAPSKRNYEQENVSYEEDTDRARMRALPEAERETIQHQVQLFRMEKAKLDREMEKWDESGNDLIIIAKQMCMIMMEMTDFMRGQGKLKSTMDVINAAIKISEAGAELDKLCNHIAEQCRDSVTKKDLMAYLQRMALYCHQLNITSKVKADVQNINGDFVVSGQLESATSLIQAAKNLMNTVVLAVRSSYVASTKYPKAGAKINVTWRMRAPEKKPLVQKEKPEDIRSNIRKGENKKSIEPIKALSEFHA